MTTTATLSARVDAGAAWLDANYPDWLEKVTINELNLKSACDCVLGQLFYTEAEVHGTMTYSAVTGRIRPAGYLWAVSEENVLDYESSVSYGFDTVNNDREFAELQRLWENKIASYVRVPELTQELVTVG